MPAHVLLIPLLAACHNPPQAPAAFDDLCSYLFAHILDEDPEVMEAGGEQLATWLDERWDPEEDSYALSPLGQPALDALDEVERHAQDLAGVAVITESAHPVDDVAWAVLMEDLSEIYAETMVTYERTPYGDPQAFLDGDLPLLETEERIHSEIDSVIDITADSHSWNQYLWIDTSVGPVLLQRNWLLEPPVIDPAWLGASEQYNIQVFVPRAHGHARVQAMWISYASDAVPVDTGLKLAANDFRSNSETLEAWMDENPH